LRIRLDGSSAVGASTMFSLSLDVFIWCKLSPF
jgi:hypothetical protein